MSQSTVRNTYLLAENFLRVPFYVKDFGLVENYFKHFKQEMIYLGHSVKS